MFTPEQRAVLMRYFEEFGMTSTHRRNTDLMQRCAQEINTTIDRVKVCYLLNKQGSLMRPGWLLAGVQVELMLFLPTHSLHGVKARM